MIDVSRKSQNADTINLVYLFSVTSPWPTANIRRKMGPVIERRGLVSLSRHRNALEVGNRGSRLVVTAVLERLVSFLTGQSLVEGL